MYHLIGIDHCLRNILLLASQYNIRAPQNMNELKKDYIASLRNVQPEVPREYIPNYDAGPLIVDDDTLEEKLMRFYRIESSLNDKDQQNIFSSFKIDRNEHQYRIDNLKIRLSQLRQTYPEYWSLFDLSINHIIVPPSRRAGGGTTSAAVGVIWINERQHWQDIDYLELFVHEQTHNLMFIDELCHAHYRSYEMVENPDFFAKSAILHERRPLDKALHSLVVAVELLEARRYTFHSFAAPSLHPENKRLRQQAIDSAHSIEDLHKWSSILEPRGVEILELCKEKLFRNSSDSLTPSKLALSR